MAFGWTAYSVPVAIGAASSVDTGTAYYIGLTILIVIMIGVLVAAYRTWEEINDVEEPDSPADLLESFEHAHQEGELDAQELERVRRLLSAGDGGDGERSREGRARGSAVTGEDMANPGEFAAGTEDRGPTA